MTDEKEICVTCGQLPDGKVRCMTCHQELKVEKECPRCHSKNTVKLGKVGTVRSGFKQRYKCKDCQHVTMK